MQSGSKSTPLCTPIGAVKAATASVYSINCLSDTNLGLSLTTGLNALSLSQKNQSSRHCIATPPYPANRLHVYLYTLARRLLNRIPFLKSQWI